MGSPSTRRGNRDSRGDRTLPQPAQVMKETADNLMQCLEEELRFNQGLHDLGARTDGFANFRNFHFNNLS